MNESEKLEELDKNLSQRAKESRRRAFRVSFAILIASLAIFSIIISLTYETTVKQKALDDLEQKIPELEKEEIQEEIRKIQRR